MQVPEIKLSKETLPYCDDAMRIALARMRLALAKRAETAKEPLPEIEIYTEAFRPVFRKRVQFDHFVSATKRAKGQTGTFHIGFDPSNPIKSLTRVLVEAEADLREKTAHAELMKKRLGLLYKVFKPLIKFVSCL